MPYLDKSKQRECLRRWRKRKRKGISKTFKPQPCVSCGKFFTPISEKHRFCSKKCSAHPIGRRYGTQIEKLGNKCRICGTKKNLTVNHIIPQCVKKDNRLSNLELLCSSCNSKEYQRIIQKALRFYFSGK